ncbi:MAG: radical SAM protein [Candidatus Hydrogenedentes bacterium]|jgi:MoaA/NifB/PqqE/SkfB family radical SAM enzyme|nr:radical SAM protein [Candidatus Hydrogenedentota bacterium]
MTITQRIDAITLVTADRYSARPPAPKSVKIELTGRCNYRCGFCALRTRKEQPTGDMDFDLFMRMTQQMRDAGVEEIGVFYLGESFMAPDLLVRAISWCKKIGFPYVFLTTNGSLCTWDRLAAVMAAGLDSLKFSVNAATPEQFVDVMGVKARLYEDALDAIKRAREVRAAGKFKCGIYASSIKYDGAQQVAMEALLSERVRPYVDEHYWLPLYSMGSLATQREAELGYKPTAGNQGRLGALREPLPCWSAFTEGHVTADGYLSACCFDADGRWRMGDLNQQTFMEAWHSLEFAALREAHLRKDVSGTPCEECVAYS